MIDDHSLAILEFPKLLAAIARYAASEPGHDAVLAFKPLEKPDSILQRVETITEIRRLTDFGEPIRLDGFADPAPVFTRLRPLEAVLKPLELRSLIPLLANAEAVSRALKGRADSPRLFELAENIPCYPVIRKLIERSIDQDGNIPDSASGELSRIRTRIRTAENRIERKLREMTARQDVGKLLQENFVTRRGGRWVIPVRRDAQGRVPGIVHDVSNSGETVFLEPLEILPLGNELGALAAQERVEEARILKEISRECRDALPGLELAAGILIALDALIASASYADAFRMTPPEIEVTNSLRITRGRHPILWEVMRANDPKTSGPVALDISLDETGFRAIVITGPNTGGKTVALKTVGLLCLMAMSGLHVPAAEGSRFPMLQTIAADIGDEQSIEQSLSTFSGHMKRASELISRSGPGSLIVLDELGSGTDPDEGGPLACAILSAIVERGGLAAASSHLGALKEFVHGRAHMLNAAMRFDHETLQPTYALDVGVPGRSHAFDIAGRCGIPADVVSAARSMVSGSKGSVDDLALELSRLRDAAEREQNLAGAARSEAEKLKAEYHEKVSSIRNKRRELLEAATAEASGVVRTARAEVERITAAVRKSAAGNPPEKAVADVARSARVELEAVESEIARIKESVAPSEFRRVSVDFLREGETYFVKSLGVGAVLAKINRKTGRCRVRTGAIEVEVSAEDLGAVAAAEKPKQDKTPIPQAPPIRFDLEQHAPVYELNLIGMRADPAIEKLERFIEQAARSGAREVRIVHGVGAGILSRAVREFLSAHPMRPSFRAGAREEGGNGATIVSFETP
ncbi:MAG: endonuclease MutS2 [Nitrospirae bacterium]|nr:endonuclease MutS2 [Nitrospirota bacterium]